VCRFGRHQRGVARADDQDIGFNLFQVCHWSFLQMTLIKRYAFDDAIAGGFGEIDDRL
jgi:hypothetical protein